MRSPCSFLLLPQTDFVFEDAREGASLLRFFYGDRIARLASSSSAGEELEGGGSPGLGPGQGADAGEQLGGAGATVVPETTCMYVWKSDEGAVFV